MGREGDRFGQNQSCHCICQSKVEALKPTLYIMSSVFGHLILIIFLLGFFQVDLGCCRGVCGDEGRGEDDRGR